MCAGFFSWGGCRQCEFSGQNQGFCGHFKFSGQNGGFSGQKAVSIKNGHVLKRDL